MSETQDIATISRRTFGQLAVASVIAITTRSNADKTAETSSSGGWIDAHVHVWTPDVAHYPIDRAFQISDMQPGSFTPEELFANCKPVGVERIVLIQMSFYGLDHRFMFHAMRSHPGVFSAVGLIDYRAANVIEQADRLASAGVRGFRLHSHGDAKEWVDDLGMAKLWKHAGESRLAICPLINPEDIPHIESLCAKFPETTVVVDHFARIGVSGSIDKAQLESLCRLAKFPQTYVKTSAFYALGKKQSPYDDLAPMIRRVLDAFGPERMMWASDCPYQVQGNHTYEASIALIRDRLEFLSDVDKKWILRRTAEKVFFG